MLLRKKTPPYVDMYTGHDDDWMPCLRNNGDRIITNAMDFCVCVFQNDEFCKII